MIEFKILKKSKKSRARLGILKTPHGEIETPTLVAVATQASVKTLSSEDVLKTKTQIIIANTFHLHLKPGENILKSAGGIHKFMNWPKPVMTDSGGFQVFSLGFGSDLKVGKILKFFPAGAKEEVKEGSQPKKVKITPEGVWFSSPANGERIFLGPKESIKIQESIGADIILAFDECTPPLADYEYAKGALKRTHDWAKICVKERKTKQALYGIVQGSHFKDLREEAAKFINSLDFDGFAIGGDLGKNKKETAKIISWTVPRLEEKKPRHLLGIGYPEDMEPAAKWGMDTFDCIVPTHYARHGTAFVSKGAGGGFVKIDLRQSKFLKDKRPLDPLCGCDVCRNYKRNYICHLFKAKEILPLSLLTFHNLYFFNSYAESVRVKIKKGLI
jgi:queuine tRNA-ribosyltransferase/7-cyano-7-deazaguanine tRNA-ribosyltransferase